MDKLNKREFSTLMLKLRSHYQNAVGDQALFAASIATYFEAFQHRHPGAVRKAFGLAWKEFPDWMPSAGQLNQLVLSCEKSAQFIGPERQLHEEKPATAEESKEKLQEILKTLTGTLTQE